MLWNDIRKRKHSEKVFPKNSVKGVNALSNYLFAAGGPAQQSRMIADKRKTLDRALKYSYQGAFVKKYYSPEVETLDFVRESEPVMALINPNKLKQDYDDKIISIGFEHEFAPGDIFEWCQTNTKWLIYLQDLTELAYFRGEIRKCSHEIAWLGEDGEQHSTFAAIRGPVETKINYIQKHSISVDTPNYSLNILMPFTKDAYNYFKRYGRFYLQNDDVKTCWRVEAVDALSMQGILEINATEYYANETEDDLEKGLVGSLKTEKINPNTDGTITGETFIKPKKEYIFTCTKLQEDAEWTFDKKLPVTVTKVWKNERNRDCISLKWTSSYSGQFVLSIGNYQKTIVVESLF